MSEETPQEKHKQLLDNLRTTLGPYVNEAIAVYRSSRYDSESLCYWHTPQSCIELLTELRISEAVNATLEELEAISLFHDEVVQPLIPRFRNWASDNFNELRLEGFDNFIQESEISAVEKIRLYRAFYRFQFCCNVYRVIRSHGVATDKARDIFEEKSHFLQYFNNFELWELEEIMIIDRFAMHQCKNFIATEHPADSDSANKLSRALLFGNGCPITKSEIGERKKGNQKEKVEARYIMRGLDVLNRLYLEKLQHDDIKKAASRIVPRLKRFFGWENDERKVIRLSSLRLDERNKKDWAFMESIFRELISYSYREKVMENGSTYSFGGDRIPDDFKSNQFPSQSWYLVHKPSSSSGAVSRKAKSSLYNTGYVFWDSARLGPSRLETFSYAVSNR